MLFFFVPFFYGVNSLFCLLCWFACSFFLHIYCKCMLQILVKQRRYETWHEMKINTRTACSPSKCCRFITAKHFLFLGFLCTVQMGTPYFGIQFVHPFVRVWQISVHRTVCRIFFKFGIRGSSVEDRWVLLHTDQWQSYCKINVFHSNPGAANWHYTHAVYQVPFVRRLLMMSK
jgi:hypothetical protein